MGTETTTETDREMESMGRERGGRREWKREEGRGRRKRGVEG